MEKPGRKKRRRLLSPKYLSTFQNRQKSSFSKRSTNYSRCPWDNAGKKIGEKKKKIAPIIFVHRLRSRVDITRVVHPVSEPRELRLSRQKLRGLFGLIVAAIDRVGLTENLKIFPIGIGVQKRSSTGRVQADFADVKSNAYEYRSIVIDNNRSPIFSEKIGQFFFSFRINRNFKI